MMFHARKWFTGFTIIQLKEGFINMQTIEVTSVPCTAYQDNLYYDCSYRRYVDFPPANRLNPKMQILNISGNLMDTLGKDDLKPYTDLRELSMHSLYLLQTLSVEFFAPVEKLEILNMNYSELSNPIKFPKSIRILYASEISSSYAKAVDLDLSQLINLSNLSFAKNEIQTFPTLHQKAPVMHINLKGNPIRYLEYMNLAPYCKLERFELENYTSGKQYAEKCCGVLAWLKKYGIYNDLKCEEIDGKKCEFESVEFNAYAIELRNECLGISTYPYVLIGNIVVGIAIFFTFVYMVIRYYRSSAVKAYRSKDKPVTEENDLEEENATDSESIADFHPLS